MFDDEATLAMDPTLTFESDHIGSVCDEGEEPTELGIWRTNNFALGRSNNKSKNGIFPELSRFNHSCVPSAEFRWNEKLHRQEIRSIRNISPGEEITLCYFTLDIMAQSKKDRQDYLEGHYGFICDCIACSLKGKKTLTLMKKVYF